MSKYKRVWAILGVVGLLGALMALSAVAPTPAGAVTGPDNHVDFLKVVQGTFDGNAGAGFTLEVSCADPDPTVVEQPGGSNPNVPFLQSRVVGAAGGAAPTIDIPAWYLNCIFYEVSANGADATIVQAIETTAGPHNANININSGANATSGNNGVVFHPAGGATIFVGIGNIYSAANNATVTITKEITGPAPVAPVFQMRVTCLEDTGAVNNDQVTPARVATAVFLGAGTQDVLIPLTGNTPVGDPTPGTAACTPVVVEDVAQPLPTGTTYIPAGANTTGLTPPVSPTDTGTAKVRSVRIINNYAGATNRTSVTKTVIGTPPAGTQYSFTLTCYSSTAMLAPYVDTQALSAGETYVFESPANRDFCAVQETNHAWAGNPDKIPDSIGVSTFPVDGVVTTSINTGCGAINGGIFSVVGAQTCSAFRFASQGGGHTASVGVTNRYLVGPYHTITVNKTITGQAAPNAVFLVLVECDVPLYTGQPAVGGRYPYYMTFGPAFAPSQSVNWPSFNTGGVDDCEVREINSDGALSVTYAGGGSSPDTLLHVFQNPGGRVEIGWNDDCLPTTVGGECEYAEVGITNRMHNKNLPDNTLRIKKQLRGNVPEGASYTIRVRCSGGGITDTTFLTFTSNSFQEIAVPANRSDCRVVETANGGAQVSYFASSATADATDGTSSARVDFGTAAGAQRGKVIVRNQFPGTCPRPGPKFC